ncbi:methionine/alanine import family NSS transporter small subunit [Microbacterium istanbulense]|uniref:Methionine/alanine import family NSS transporter small subunit n=1 Tax=Microbacterium istanbulense TaxID=3122049 RepID=A0ABU8LJN6_9MICO
MTPIAITFLVIALVVVWGGLVTSTIMLVRRPEVDRYPPGGTAAEAADHAG